MKFLSGILLLLAFGTRGVAQYYYKDIIITGQTIENWKSYKQAAVKAVILKSFESNGQPIEDFHCQQQVNGDFSQIVTYTGSVSNSSSALIASYDSKGLLKKTVDTSDTFQSTTLYEFDANSHVLSITNTGTETDNNRNDIEEHLWRYKNDKPVVMIKIKNRTDTTYIDFVQDEKGNIIEEHPVHNNSKLPVIYYYYNDNNLLTDIVRFNMKAKRLLPDYVFDYNDKMQIRSMLMVPEGSNEYQKWLYEYNEKGLKITDACFSKQKQLLGKIEYQYSFR